MSTYLAKCVLSNKRSRLLLWLPLLLFPATISAQYYCQYDDLLLDNTGQTKLELGQITYLYRCASGHPNWIVSSYGSYSINLNEIVTSENKGKLRRATDIESAFAKSTNFVSSLVNATNSTKEEMSLAHSSLYDGIATRQLSGASDLYKQCAPSVLLLISLDRSSLGSGTLVSNNGEVITNWHVVKGQEKMLAWFYKKGLTELKNLDPENYAIAEVIATDQKRDLALLKLNSINEMKLNPVRFGRYGSLEVAQDVFAIGHPEALAWSFTYGVISQLRNDYVWSYSNEVELTADIIQTQTPINPGNSGGPLFNERGELIGVNSFGAQRGAGLNFAVSVDEVRSFLSEASAGKHKPIITETVTSIEENENCLPIDSNNNGVTDMLLFDVDADGINDLALVDENEDGDFDFIVGDINNDQAVDLMIYDKDGDGSFEYSVIDTDYDGHWDTIGVDTNGDLEPDRMYAYTEE